MRLAVLGLAALAVLSFVLWMTGPSVRAPAAHVAGETAADFAQRIALDRGVSGAVPLTIAVEGATPLPPAPERPADAGHRNAAVDAVWGAPGEFAPPED